MADASVRTARREDSEAIARVQQAAWRSAYAGVLPTDVVDGLDSPTAIDQWRRAVVAPPSPRHRVLVALSGADVVGFAAFGPAEDPDLDDTGDAELHALCVAPDQAGKGHGSRLVNACADHLRACGFRRAHTWLVFDDRLRAFLASSGWTPDGASRSLDLRGDGAVVVPQVRLHTGLGEMA